ncbi:peptide chain release factor N(5)-glutamine methyltransferase [Buchnera aphidicola (Aphis helianthi)]|uniref:Release factor glutamine methyltransferase n=1 Tax=Buchnera aphidicola (Aphis helianthi) TaxID=2315802 RepID=A0A4D6XPM7_9GAMM|nr:peptide chain release factor N(5)-glutamine methyltransferase [Buchnera aphidicola]QCI17004.1 peptide chain release factor N(5)-glutamine methyltransferase [Buchnera aphidicola (Aphis helianthi)]
MKIYEWLDKTIKIFSHLDYPKYEAEILLCHVLQRSRSWIIAFDRTELNELNQKILKKFVYRRSIREPMAYILGKKEFWSLSLRVSQDTLIPRPDTEILVEQVLSKIDRNKIYILDLGTGCGAIGLALASVCKNFNITAVDNSNKAIKIAKINALELSLNNIVFFYSNWFSNINQKFHIIVSNPPYLSLKEMHFFKKDLIFEPVNALVSKNNGLKDIELIIKQSKNYLFCKGWLFIEHGWKQKFKVRFLFKKYNFFNITSYKDYGGNDRITIGQKK